MTSDGVGAFPWLKAQPTCDSDTEGSRMKSSRNQAPHKRVYLFELDSTRSTDAEIIRGQQALYHEVTVNGNVVVLTYNQLVDSRGFTSLLRDDGDKRLKSYRQNLMDLFQMGYIKVSQFDSTRTVVQYLINSIDNQGFIYTALPVKSSQRRLLALMRRSLVYSDLGELERYVAIDANSGQGLQDELADLFTEVEADDTERHTDLGLRDMHDILANLAGMLRFALALSGNTGIYVPPRNRKDYATGIHLVQDGRIVDPPANKELALILSNILVQACRMEAPSNLNMPFDDAVSLLERIITTEVASNEVDHRSNILAAIRRLWKTEGLDWESCASAEAVVDVCYNYACEISICDVSKHYDVNELRHLNSPKTSFGPDFFLRLRELWGKDAYNVARFLKDETNVYVSFNQVDKIPHFDEAVRLLQLTIMKQGTKDEPASKPTGETLLPRYEDNLVSQEEDVRSRLSRAIRRRLWLFAFYALFAVALEVVADKGQDWFDGIVGAMPDLPNWLPSILETTLFLVLSELLSSCLGKVGHPLPPLSESVVEIRRLIAAGRHLQIDDLPDSHVNEALTKSNLPSQEKRNMVAQVGPSPSRALGAYVALKDKGGIANTVRHLFAPSDVYPIADISDRNTLGLIRRDEELHQRTYGVVYQSRFHRLVVDPIVRTDAKDGKGAFFPYERVIPVADGGGVVVVALYESRHVLIRQFRHAPRKEQVGYVRGFSEPGARPEEDAQRELEEEIAGRVAGSPRLLGAIEPDSGFQASDTAVVLVELSSYGRLQSEEGVREVLEVEEAELVGMIARGEIDDGFTLAAFQLYRSKLPSLP